MYNSVHKVLITDLSVGRYYHCVPVAVKRHVLAKGHPGNSQVYSDLSQGVPAIALNCAVSCMQIMTHFTSLIFGGVKMHSQLV